MGKNGLLLRYITNIDDPEKGDSPFEVVGPHSQRKMFLRYYHYSAFTGNSSGRKSYSKLCRITAWRGMKKDVLHHSRSCRACQVAKPRGGKPLGLEQRVTNQRPWEISSCDDMESYPRSPHGNEYLLVITDHFYKWVEVIPLRKLVS